MQNITLNVLKDLFESIADSHAFINSFGLGEPWEITARTVEFYPLFWVELLPSTFTSKTITYNFRFWMMDLVNKDESNELEVQSDSVQTLWDIIQLLKYQSYTNYIFNIDYDNINITPFTEETDDEVSGYYADVAIIVPRVLGYCDVPLKPVTIDGLYIFYGIKDTYSIFSDVNDIINSTKYSITSDQIINDVAVNWTSFNSSPQYCWVAIPYTDTSLIKNHWFVDSLNQGEIGSTELFNTLQIVNISGTNYQVFITNFKTQFNANCLMQKI